MTKPTSDSDYIELCSVIASLYSGLDDAIHRFGNVGEDFDLVPLTNTARAVLARSERHYGPGFAVDPGCCNPGDLLNYIADGSLSPLEAAKTAAGCLVDVADWATRLRSVQVDEHGQLVVSTPSGVKVWAANLGTIPEHESDLLPILWQAGFADTTRETDQVKACTERDSHNHRLAVWLPAPGLGRSIASSVVCYAPLMSPCNSTKKFPQGQCSATNEWSCLINGALDRWDGHGDNSATDGPIWVYQLPGDEGDWVWSRKDPSGN
jgi:hypothetical protein